MSRGGNTGELGAIAEGKRLSRREHIQRWVSRPERGFGIRMWRILDCVLMLRIFCLEIMLMKVESWLKAGEGRWEETPS